MNICNEAAITAARKSKKKVDMRYTYTIPPSPLSHTFPLLLHHSLLVYITHITLLNYTKLTVTSSLRQTA